MACSSTKRPWDILQVALLLLPLVVALGLVAADAAPTTTDGAVFTFVYGTADFATVLGNPVDAGRVTRFGTSSASTFETAMAFRSLAISVVLVELFPGSGSGMHAKLHMAGQTNITMSVIYAAALDAVSAGEIVGVAVEGEPHAATSVLDPSSTTVLTSTTAITTRPTEGAANPVEVDPYGPYYVLIFAVAVVVVAVLMVLLLRGHKRKLRNRPSWFLPARSSCSSFASRSSYVSLGPGAPNNQKETRRVRPSSRALVTLSAVSEETEQGAEEPSYPASASKGRRLSCLMECSDHQRHLRLPQLPPIEVLLPDDLMETETPHTLSPKLIRRISAPSPPLTLALPSDWSDQTSILSLVTSNTAGNEIGEQQATTEIQTANEKRLVSYLQEHFPQQQPILEPGSRQSLCFTPEDVFVAKIPDPETGLAVSSFGKRSSVPAVINTTPCLKVETPEIDGSGYLSIEDTSEQEDNDSDSYQPSRSRTTQLACTRPDSGDISEGRPKNAALTDMPQNEAAGETDEASHRRKSVQPELMLV